MATKPKRTATETLQDTIRTILDSDPTMGKSWKRGMLRYYFKRYAEVCFIDAGITEVSEDSFELVALQMLETALSGLDGWQSYVEELIQNGDARRTP
jgi:hypothetical protein